MQHYDRTMLHSSLFINMLRLQEHSACEPEENASVMIRSSIILLLSGARHY
jgi:hypothetical protein